MVDKLLSLTDTGRMTTANHGDAETTRPAPSTARQGRIPADTFSNRLVLARRLAGLTIREAAAQAGLNYGSWSNWENGMRPQDAVGVCTAIAPALDVDFNWLLLGGPLEGPRGRVIPKRSGSFRVAYLKQTVRATPDRPKVRTDQPRPISAQVGQARRANRVNTERAAEVIYAA